MKPKDDLFLLIRSMSKNEKGYFTKFARMHSSTDGNYIRLFNLLDAMEVYDETAVKKAFEGEKFIKQLGVTKNHLFKLILRTLSSYHRENIPDLHIYHLLAEERILRSRKISDTNNVQLKKAAAIVEQFGEAQFIPLIQWVKYAQNPSHMFQDLNDVEFAEWKGEFIKAAEHQLQDMQYTVLQMEITRHIVSNNKAGDENTRKALDMVVANPLMQHEPEHLSVRTRVSYWETWARYYQAVDNMEGYTIAYQATYELLERQSSEYLQDNINVYISAIYTLCVVRLSSGQLPEAMQLLNKLKSVDASHNPTVDLLKQRCQIELELEYIQLFGKRGEVIVFEGRCRTILDKVYADDIHFNKGGIRISMGIALMLDSAPAVALDYLNWLLNDNSFATYNYFPMCWYWSILAHNELGNKELIPSLASAAMRNLKKHLAINPIEQQLLKGLAKLSKTNTRKAEQEQLATIRENLQQGVATLSQENQPHYKEMLKWFGQKLSIA